MATLCFHCGTPAGVVAFGRPGRRDTCSMCGTDLHCCRNCDFYSPQASNECREPQADRVVEKNRANFCDYFRFADGRGPAQRDSKAALKALDDLFKK